MCFPCAIFAVNNAARLVAEFSFMGSRRAACGGALWAGHLPAVALIHPDLADLRFAASAGRAAQPRGRAAARHHRRRVGFKPAWQMPRAGRSRARSAWSSWARRSAAATASPSCQRGRGVQSARSTRPTGTRTGITPIRHDQPRPAAPGQGGKASLDPAPLAAGSASYRGDAREWLINL